MGAIPRQRREPCVLGGFGGTGRKFSGRDTLSHWEEAHVDDACDCCCCVDRVRIDRGRTRLVRVTAADGQRTSSVTSGGQLALYRQKFVHSPTSRSHC